jgi:hypothetical protein
VLSPDPKAARAAIEDAVFARDRLHTVLPQLQAQLAKVQRAEKKAAWVREYEEIVPRVNALAAELRSVHTEFEPKIVDILTHARVLDAEVRRVRSRKPPPECGEKAMAFTYTRSS